MTNIVLSQRLSRVAAFIPKGSRLADIGSDHAYLPLFLVGRGHIPYAIAGEVAQGPYRSTCSHIKANHCHGQIVARLASGLEAIDKQDGITAISICGMGGRLITDILADGKHRLYGVEDLVLQPNNREDDLREWLSGNDWAIYEEAIVEEKGSYYEIIHAKPGYQSLSPFDKRFGPYLRQEQSPAFCAKWHKEKQQLEAIFERIPAENRTNRQEIAERLAAIKEVLA